MRKQFIIILSFIFFLQIIVDAQSSQNPYYSLQSSYLEHSEKLVREIHFSPNNKHLATIAVDKKIIIWDVKTGRKSKILEPKVKKITRIKYSPDGKYLACKSKKFVFIWDTSNWNLIAKYKKFWKDSPIEFHPHKTQIIGASIHSVIAYDFINESETKIDIAAGSVRERYIHSIKITPDGKFLYTYSIDKKRNFKIYDLEKKEFYTFFKFSKSLKKREIYSNFTLSPDGKLLIYKSSSDFVIIETKTRQPVLSIGNSISAGNAFFTNNSKHLIVHSLNGLTVYDLFGKKILLQMESGEELEEDTLMFRNWADISNNGRFIAATDREGKVIIWDMRKLSKK